MSVICYIIIENLFFTCLKTMIIYCGIFYYFWKFAIYINPQENEITTSCICCIILSTSNFLVSLPFNIYGTFVIEEKYGFNKQTIKLFICDKIISYILMQLDIPIVAFAIFIMEVGGDYFYIWWWLIVAILLLFVLIICVTCIFPLLDKFTPLPDGELRTLIGNLASEVKFPLEQIYVVEASKRSGHSNAYYFGLCGVKRIVLYDTLIGTVSNKEEVLAVLSHELGHWYHGHIYKKIIIIEINIFINFVCIALMYNYTPLYTAFSFPESKKPILFGFIAIIYFVMNPYNVLSVFVLNVTSRHYEYQADAFAIKLHKEEYLIRALIKLYTNNLDFPIYDSWYSIWYFDHPTLLQRINALEQAHK